MNYQFTSQKNLQQEKKTKINKSNQTKTDKTKIEIKATSKKKEIQKYLRQKEKVILTNKN